jgi:hypothetical protein
MTYPGGKTPSGPLLLLPVLAFTSLFCTFHPSCTALKMGAARSSYTLVSIYQFTLCHSPGDENAVPVLRCCVVTNKSAWIKFHVRMHMPYNCGNHGIIIFNTNVMKSV